MKKDGIKAKVLGSFKLAALRGGMESNVELLPTGRKYHGGGVCMALRMQVATVELALFAGPVERHGTNYYIVREGGSLYLPGFSDFLADTLPVWGPDIDRLGSLEWSLYALLRNSEHNPFNHQDWSQYIKTDQYADAARFLAPCFGRLAEGITRLVADPTVLELVLQSRRPGVAEQLSALNLNFVWQTMFDPDLALAAFRTYRQDVEYMPQAIDLIEKRIAHLSHCIDLPEAEWNWQINNIGVWIPRDAYLGGLQRLLWKAKQCGGTGRVH
jgi:hypothetical protein